jgi:hypothetical protein
LSLYPRYNKCIWFSSIVSHSFQLL